ncbi:pyridoxine 5'-phosphate oxidase C-terminal domain-containing protein, partial [Aggregatibacter kilianii]|uniref:pyridoxine 5'-phosphate oxidase C-terminal domain-containing protein n=1 Tax=Aggregatibacter kilianii TaxID=2025884 RepID=UPI00248E54B0
LLAAHPPLNVPRPPHWGGYLVTPDRIEFWQGRPSRLHDRICYLLENGEWKKVRLSP